MELAPAITDADLLSRYLREGDERAFASLVRAHERMVIGTAWRYTGDSELARDVAQQVFATLAQKATLLAGRKSLAGWLHIAATHYATRTRMAEAARRTRHEQASIQATERDSGDAGPLLEEALSRLSSVEREALVLHYFEDRSYAEMAIALGLQETAVRKRVSRALEQLGTQLRRRGFRGSAVAALVGASALPAGLPSTVAAGAAIALPTVAADSSLALTLHTLMGNTAVKIIAAAVVASAIPNAWQSHANSALRSEVVELRRTTNRESRPAPQSPSHAAALRAELAALSQRLADVQRQGEEAKTKLAEGQGQLDRIQREVIVKFGRTEELARTFAAKLAEILPVFSELEKKKPLDAAMKEKVDRVSKLAMELLPLMGQLRQLDEQPEQAARFTSTVFGEVLKLPPETTSALEQIVEQGYSDLKRDGLTLSRRPAGEGAAEWAERRNAADKAVTARLLNVLPENARNHPILKLLGDEAGILLPPDAAILGGFPPTGGAADFLKANPHQADSSRPK
jgi:RNA polymerase sigma factor (sigma-70 family)